jgi:hypothetical protein
MNVFDQGIKFVEHGRSVVVQDCWKKSPAMQPLQIMSLYSQFAEGAFSGKASFSQNQTGGSNADNPECDEMRLLAMTICHELV